MASNKRSKGNGNLNNDNGSNSFYSFILARENHYSASPDPLRGINPDIFRKLGMM